MAQTERGQPLALCVCVCPVRMIRVSCACAVLRCFVRARPLRLLCSRVLCVSSIARFSSLIFRVTGLLREVHPPVQIERFRKASERAKAEATSGEEGAGGTACKPPSVASCFLSFLSVCFCSGFAVFSSLWLSIASDRFFTLRFVVVCCRLVFTAFFFHS